MNNQGDCARLDVGLGQHAPDTRRHAFLGCPRRGQHLGGMALLAFLQHHIRKCAADVHSDTGRQALLPRHAKISVNWLE